MKKNPSILVAALLLTAILLGVVLIAMPQKTAEGSMITVTPAVTMLTMGREDGSTQYIMVVDKSSNKLLVYNMSPNNTLDLVAVTDYTRVFGAVGPAAGGGAGNPGLHY